MPTAAPTATSIRDLINAELLDPDEPDPHTLTDRVLEIATDEQRDEVLRPGVLALVLESIRLHRQRERGRGNGGSGKGRSRRKREHDELLQRMQVGGAWKFLGDCTADDLITVAHDYRLRSIQESQLADQFERDAEELRSSGCTTLRELREQQED